jgi:hypothetical protein
VNDATINLTNGIIQSGTIQGGTIAGTTSGLLEGGVTLDPVTYQGTLEVAQDQTVTIADGITLQGAGGTGAGTIDLTHPQSVLGIATTETLDNAVVYFGTVYSPTAGYDPSIIVAAGAELALGANLTIDAVGAGVLTGPNIVNDGTIDATNGNGTGVFIDTTSFTNNATINLDNGGDVWLGYNPSSAFQTGFTLVNTGVINLTDGIIYGGVIQGGTIAGTASGLLEDGVTLQDVTYQGTLEAAVFITDGITLEGAGGIGAGAIDVTHNQTYLGIETTETLDNAVVYFGNVYSTTPGVDPSIIVAAGAALTLGPDLTIDAVGAGVLTGPNVVNDGTIDATNGNGTGVFIDTTSFTNNATINLDNGGDLWVGYNPSSGFQTGFTLVNDGVINLTDGIIYGGVIQGGTIAGTASGLLEDGVTLQDVTYQGTLDASVFIGDGFTLEGTGGTGAGTIGGTGTIVINADAFLTGTGGIQSTTNNYGIIEADTGLLRIDGILTGPGALEIAAGSTLELGGATEENVSFTGSSGLPPVGGVLAIDGGASDTGVVSGLGAGDIIELLGYTVADASITGTTLTADLVGGGTKTLEVAPGLNGLHFSIGTGQDGLSDAITVEAAPCFCPGTLIETDRGAVPVERLAVGDAILTATGQIRSIVWIGYRHLNCRRHPKPKKVWPVRVATGAFGDNLPHRDLWLSPDHSVYIDDVLIPIKHLINGTSIAQVPVDQVTYYHVELPQHDVLLAEGLPAESYLNTGDRSKFANGGGATALHPDFSARAWDIALTWEALGCAPLIVTGPELVAVRQRVNTRAATLDRPDASTQRIA